MNKNKLNMLVRQFAGENVSFYFHNARINTQVSQKEYFSNEFLKEFSKKYYEIFSANNLKENRLYLTAIYSLLSKAEKISFKNQNIETKKKQIRTYLKSFSQKCNVIEQNLNHFKPYRLGIYELNGVKFSSQLELYNYLIGDKFTKVRVPNAPLDFYLNGNLNEIFPSQHTMQLNYNDGTKKFVKTIELKDYPNTSFSGIFDSLIKHKRKFYLQI